MNLSDMVLQWLPVVWLVVAVLLVVAEVGTAELVAIWFALGAVAALIASLFSLPFLGQIGVFLGVSILALIGTRPFIKKVLVVRHVRTNADSFIGQVGTVINDIEGAQHVGRVNVSGQDWSAVSEDGQPIFQGEQVLVKAIEGVKLVVQKVV